MKRILKHLAASYLRALAAAAGTLQIVTHGAGVSISGGWQALAALLGAGVAPLALALTQTADILDREPPAV